MRQGLFGKLPVSLRDEPEPDDTKSHTCTEAASFEAAHFPDKAWGLVLRALGNRHGQN